MILSAIEETPKDSTVLSAANKLAQDCDDELEVLNVIPQKVFENNWRNDSEYQLDAAIEEATSNAHEAINSTLDSTVDITAKGRVGDVVVEIQKEADRVDAQYIVIGGRNRSPSGKAVFGSHTQSILLSAERPVLTVMTD